MGEVWRTTRGKPRPVNLRLAQGHCCSASRSALPSGHRLAVDIRALLLICSRHAWWGAKGISRPPAQHSGRADRPTATSHQQPSSLPAACGLRRTLREQSPLIERKDL